MNLFLLVITVYVLVLIGIGIYKSFQIKSQDDFMVAGRSVSMWFLVGTLVCTWVGSGTLFGSAGLSFRDGFSALWMSAGAWVGIVCVYFLAGRVRKIAEYTVPDILEKRYNATARILGTITIVIAYMSIAGYQFKGGGRLLNIITRTDPHNAATGLDPFVGALITCGVVVLFTLLAGMVSIIAADLVNGLIITISVIIGVPLLLFGSDIGSWNFVTETLPNDHFTALGTHNAWWVIGIFFPTFFLLMGESSIYQKFFAAKDEATAKKAVIGMVIGVIFVEGMLCLLSIIGSAKHWSNPIFKTADGGIDPSMSETVVLHIARFDLPEVAGALLMAAAVAIILSTANTFLMIPSTNITRDIYQRFINPQADQKTIITMQRVLIVVIALAAFLLATQFQTILAMAFTAYTMVGAGITPVLLASFLWKRVTPQGGVASMVASMIVTVGITVANAVMDQPLLEADYIIIPAIVSSLGCLIFVSLMTKPSPEEKYAPFMSAGQ